MTLLVGILCEKGAVIAADRQASHGSLGHVTVGHETPKIRKLTVTMLSASSGPVGLGQHLAHIFATNAPTISAQPYFNIFPPLQQAVRNVLGPAFATAAQAQQVIGPAAQLDAVCSCLVAAVFADGLRLVEISHQGGFEHLTHDVPYVCVGSGKPNADPFIKFLWSVYWGPERHPSVQGAVLTAYWTVKATIDARTSGVGYSPDVALLSEDDSGGYAAKVYQEDELLEHASFIDQAHDALRAVRDKMLDRSQAGAEQVASDPPPTLNSPP